MCIYIILHIYTILHIYNIIYIYNIYIYIIYSYIYIYPPYILQKRPVRSERSKARPARLVPNALFFGAKKKSPGQGDRDSRKIRGENREI